VPTVNDLTALYESFLLAPVPGPGVCRTCLTFTDGHAQCYPCSTRQSWLDAMAPISYSVAHEQLHHALVSYKRMNGVAGRRLQVELAALLWRFLAGHERCLAHEAGVAHFDLVTTVPSTTAQRDEPQPLARIVGELCGPTRDRYQPLLVRGRDPTPPHDFDTHKFEPTRALDRAAILLIDDTWTTGATAQSAAAALKRAGARTVAAVAIGRHLKRDWRENGTRLRGLVERFDWDSCVHCVSASIDSAPVWHRK